MGSIVEKTVIGLTRQVYVRLFENQQSNLLPAIGFHDLVDHCISSGYVPSHLVEFAFGETPNSSKDEEGIEGVSLTFPSGHFDEGSEGSVAKLA